MTRQTTIPAVTDEERDTLREMYDEVIVPTSSRNGVKRFHIPADDHSLDKLCVDHANESTRQNGRRRFRRVDLAVYPVGYNDWCKWCLRRWRDGP